MRKTLSCLFMYLEAKRIISENHTVIFDPKSLACISSAKGAFVMGTPYCYLEQYAERLTGRPDAIPS